MESSTIVYYKDIESRNINWLWYPYIPYGKITIVQGDPGEGKTTFVLSLLSILSTGGILPCTDKKISGNAIYQNAEDDNADTIKPRLERCGADCSKICFVEKPNGLFSIDDDMEDWIREADAKVLVLDPIQSFLGENMDMNRANSVRPWMNRLKEIAEKTGCAVILIGHLNKNISGKASYRGLGSIDFSAAARSVLAIGSPAERPEIRVMAQQKNNLAPVGQSLAFSLKNGKVTWLGPYNITADELFSYSVPEKESSKITGAMIFLSGFLRNGEKSFNEIKDMALDAGISKRTLIRAKAEMSISSIKKADGWYWKLNDNEDDEQ